MPGLEAFIANSKGFGASATLNFSTRSKNSGEETSGCFGKKPLSKPTLLAALSKKVGPLLATFVRAFEAPPKPSFIPPIKPGPSGLIP